MQPCCDQVLLKQLSHIILLFFICYRIKYNTETRVFDLGISETETKKGVDKEEEIAETEGEKGQEVPMIRFCLNKRIKGR